MFVHLCFTRGGAEVQDHEVVQGHEVTGILALQPVCAFKVYTLSLHHGVSQERCRALFLSPRQAVEHVGRDCVQQVLQVEAAGTRCQLCWFYGKHVRLDRQKERSSPPVFGSLWWCEVLDPQWPIQCLIQLSSISLDECTNFHLGEFFKYKNATVPGWLKPHCAQHILRILYLIPWALRLVRRQAHAQVVNSHCWEKGKGEILNGVSCRRGAGM